MVISNIFKALESLAQANPHSAYAPQKIIRTEYNIACFKKYLCGINYVAAINVSDKNQQG